MTAFAVAPGAEPASAAITWDGYGVAVADTTENGDHLGIQFERLRSRTFRTMIAWNAPPIMIQQVANRINVARAAGATQILVSMDHDGTRSRPTAAAYQESIEPIVEQLAPGNSVAPYIATYTSHGGGWGDATGWHPYWGIHRRDLTSTNQFIAASIAAPGGAAADHPIWITESGGFISYPARPRKAWYLWCQMSHGGNAAASDCQLPPGTPVPGTPDPPVLDGGSAPDPLLQGTVVGQSAALPATSGSAPRPRSHLTDALTARLAGAKRRPPRRAAGSPGAPGRALVGGRPQWMRWSPE